MTCVGGLIDHYGYLEPMLTEWSETDPKAAAEFAVQNSSGETRENLIAAISYPWAQTNPADPNPLLVFAQQMKTFPSST